MNSDFLHFAKKQLLSLSQLHELWADTLSNVQNLDQTLKEEEEK
jgi:hypothetical protein